MKTGITENPMNDIRNLDYALVKYKDAKNIDPPLGGWINKIRTTIRMSLKQLGDRIEEPILNEERIIVDYKKASVTPQAILEYEKNEANGTITLKSLRKIAKALNLKFVYGFVPLERTGIITNHSDSLFSMIENKAKKAAEEFYQKEENKINFDGETNIEYEKLMKIVIHKKKTEIINKHLQTLWD